MSLHKFSISSAIFTVLVSLVAAPAVCAEPLISEANALPKPTKASFSPQEKSAPTVPASDLEALVFTAPPRESPEAGKQVYGPVAEYLTQVLGKRVRYRHPGTWGAYRSEMLKGAYDLVFDGPHFNSYRAEKLNHNVLAKFPDRHEFVVIVRQEEKFSTVTQMGGRLFCSQSPPNLGALILLSQ
jgi:ABC-type phosphate/phosphonate transport system substrate-binding protein